MWKREGGKIIAQSRRICERNFKKRRWASVNNRGKRRGDTDGEISQGGVEEQAGEIKDAGNGRIVMWKGLSLGDTGKAASIVKAFLRLFVGGDHHSFATLASHAEKAEGKKLSPTKKTTWEELEGATNKRRGSPILLFSRRGTVLGVAREGSPKSQMWSKWERPGNGGGVGYEL